MKTFSLLTIVVLCLFSASCSDKKQESQTLILANNLHLEAIETQESLEQKLLHIRNYALKAHNRLLIHEADSLKEQVELWKESVMEVPGFDHEHKHGEHHDHKPAIKMTDISMLQYQQEAKNAIDSLEHGVLILEEKYKTILR